LRPPNFKVKKTNKKEPLITIPYETVVSKIYLIREHKIMIGIWQNSME
jgi:hypothetical protein